MNRDDDRFEEYLGSFAGPVPTPDVVSRALRSARRRRSARRLVLLSAVTLAVCAGGLVVTLHRQADTPVTTTHRAARQPAPKTTPPVQGVADQGVLMRAYLDGGMETLGVHLDRIARCCEPGDPRDRVTWASVRQTY